MILAHNLDPDGNLMILIGLSRANVDQLLEGRPILKGPQDTGVNVHVVIVGGETEDEIMQQLKEAGLGFDEVQDLRKGPN